MLRPWLEERIDPDFETLIKDFRKTSLSRIFELIEKYKEDKQIIIFNAREEADKHLLDLQNDSLM